MSFAAVQSAFPDRPLTINAPVTRWRGWFAALVLLVLCGFFAWWASASIVPNLVSDFQIRDGAVPTSGRVENGRCRSRFGMLQTCEMVLVANAQTKDGQLLRQQADYIFVDPHLGSYSVQLLADPSRPGKLSTDLGMRHLTNRAITFLVVAALMAFLLVGAIVLLRAGGRAKRNMQALSGQRLIPVPVRVKGDQNGWNVLPLEAKRGTQWPMPKKAEPFWLDPDSGVALGVTAPGGPVFALDRELSWADFTEEERMRLRAAAPQA
ncbi:hypothetical protein SAMN02745194_02674 [Roseomonas rosea]|uniref:Uncharacterized protein n=1 Tax=Muricoccus roseus TaxID=198092 RepID=A0A1M6JM31_9PROT|nr:hypothetical protein [Roseomonas rosea]SHJ47722.1 hypothetical protein SAMN02745194_02674 [Roseomonas rosea]